MTSRRGFLRALGIGAVSLAAALAIPAAVVKAVGLTESCRLYACEYLRKIYNAHMDAHGFRQPIHIMAVGRELFEAYEVELTPNQRFTSADPCFASGLTFKGAIIMDRGAGWWAKVESCHLSA